MLSCLSARHQKECWSESENATVINNGIGLSDAVDLEFQVRNESFSRRVALPVFAEQVDALL